MQISITTENVLTQWSFIDFEVIGLQCYRFVFAFSRREDQTQTKQTIQRAVLISSRRLFMNV